MMRVEYSSNNSGGSWWLKDKDWKALEDAGWEVMWGKSYFCHSTFSFSDRPEGKPEPCASSKECKGHRRFDSYDEAVSAGRDARWLGALATDASKDFPSIKDAIVEWESITGQDASDEGCNCCGAPHSFSAGHEYVSGEEVVGVLYSNAPKSLREAAKMLERNK